MTREEAIKVLKGLRFPLCTEPEKEYVINVIDMAIADMEKQIPKKPLEIVTEDNEFICMICPSCQEIAVEFDDKYCRRCGQALDWSEENDNRKDD